MIPIESTYNKFFAHYYDELYKKNNYSLQIENLIAIFKKYKVLNHSNIVDIGCGTGEHALYLAKSKYIVHGIDPSPYMIEKALKKTQIINNLSFSCEYANTLSSIFDAGYSLFNVVNCLQNTDALKSFFIDTAKLLAPNSCFVFEAWRSDQVLAEPPVTKQDILECQNQKITRRVIPSFDNKKETIKLIYIYSIDSLEETITHFIRLFTEKELSTAFTDAGFTVQEIIPSLSTYHISTTFTSKDRYTTYILTKNS